MTLRSVLLTACLTAVATSFAAQTPDSAASPDPAQSHLEAARRLAVGDLPLLCGGSPRPEMDPSDNTTAEPPTRAFDNLYYVGVKSVSAWALKTSAGIILIDAPWNAEYSKNVVARGLLSLGLDPAQVRYVVVTHGHTDHYGGAQYFKDTYGAKIVMSQVDAATKLRNPAGFPEAAAMPVPDVFATDGYQLVLGDTMLTLFATPGHTAGSFSLIVPVFDHGTRHMAALWGGSGFPGRAPMQDAYRQSLAHFRQATDAARVDVALGNHIEQDGESAKLAKIRAGASPNPLILGQDGYRRFMSMRGECLEAFAVK